MFGMEIWQLAVAVGVAVLAGFVKGAIGFALPMIMLSVYASIFDADTALALLILPVTATNVAQALRQGWCEAWKTAVQYRVHLITLLVYIAISANFVTILPQAVAYALLGGPIILYSVSEILGYGFRLHTRHAKRFEFWSSVVGGLFGGISGIWGPPLIAYLMSMKVEKTEAMRIMGVSFFAGGVMLTGAHLMTGVMNAHTFPMSALLVIPSFVGLWLGFRAHDRLNAVMFRRATLFVLMLTGMNLLRKAFMG
ncbi:sulfite exporter TauE/SafE family protein [Thioclava kandeliae]|uniref:Probable membrane transporter protein n=1 Tax=Thioclava kandeliae TaxID=3070818 RepID=A0ABV1SFJ4_9RHOB